VAEQAQEMQDLQKTVRRHFPSLLAVEVVNYFYKHDKDVAELEHIAAGIGAKPQAVRQKANELVARGVLKKMGGNVYNLSGDPETMERIQAVMRQWNNPKARPRIMAMLDSEAGGDGFFSRLKNLFRR
jgi:hypothetical protein